MTSYDLYYDLHIEHTVIVWILGPIPEKVSNINHIGNTTNISNTETIGTSNIPTIGNLRDITSNILAKTPI